MKHKYILGIHDGHNASVCLLKDNVVVSLESEERFNGVKNFIGYPKNSIDWILENNNITLKDLDGISFPHCVPPVGFEGLSKDLRHKILKILTSRLPNFIFRSNIVYQLYLFIFSRKRKGQIEDYSNQFGINNKLIEIVDHHTAHAYAAIHTSGYVEKYKDILCITLDYSGDGLSGSVGLYCNGKYKVQKKIKTVDSLGYFYACAAEVLNMKPGHDEYKIMGMAPYVLRDRHEFIIEKFSDLFSISNGCIKNQFGFSESGVVKLKRALSDLRFDEIAFGFQYKFEEYLIEFVEYWSGFLNVRNVVFGGGSFMNVKANMLLAQSSALNNVYFMPSSGDESTCIGAAYYYAEKYSSESKKIKSLCLGREFDNEYVLDVLKNNKHISFVRSNDILNETAKILAEGKLIGRFSGKAEWGARALGNRSIICRADNLSNVHKINQAIKARDFWMPFAPAILDDYKDKYLIGFRGDDHEFMTVSYPVTKLAMNDLSAAVHMYDKTARPMIVNEENNLDFYNILSKFEQLTGLGGVLNTSFNLHRKPIVNDPQDAINTFLNSGLDILIINDYIVKK